jgi:hypothetical protein
MQIIANQAPIGFEAEFVNQRGSTIMYRGILLPYSSDDDTIDFIYGVINWKEIADQLTSDELLLEIDQALEAPTEAKPEMSRMPDPVTDWADGPGAFQRAGKAPVDLSQVPTDPLPEDPFPLPAFGNDDDGLELADEEDEPLDLYEAIEAVDDEPEGPSRFASLLSLGGGSSSPGAFGEEDEEDYGDEDEDPVAKWLKRPTPLDDLPAEHLAEPKFSHRAPIDLASFDDETVAPIFAEPDPLELTDAIETPAHEDEDEVIEPELTSHSDAAFANDPPPLELIDSYEAGPADAASPVAEFSVSATPDTPCELGLYDCLAAARELAQAARSSEDRSRTALYAAVGRAYDFSLAAQAEPRAFVEMIADSGLSVQERAPMTPVVKLVFGADYDKTRIAEYASVLNHAHRAGIERGRLADYLATTEGGLKGVVQAEREARKADSGETARETPREALARKLRGIAPLGFEDIAPEGEEFSLIMIRRIEGEVVLLGEVADGALVEKVARKLVA